MSDDFDKEAEREKLREKYESEAEDRASTERMSELLLKGATMTNKHCGHCGDPIFRHDGQEFCPTCAQGDADAGSQAAAANPTDRPDTQPTAQEDTRPTDKPDTGTAGERVEHTETPQTHTQDATAGTTMPDGASRRTTTPEHPTRPESPEGRPDDPVGDAVAVDRNAVAQVEATIERFAAEAASTDDPTRAQECLDVVRTAAETLRVLRADQR